MIGAGTIVDASAAAQEFSRERKGRLRRTTVLVDSRGCE
jgi:hypothetical protein